MRYLLLFTLASALPAVAQTVLAGEWTPIRHEDQAERGPGPELGDYVGLPINDAARFFADSWDASRLTVMEHQCRVHVSPYIYRGPLHLRIWEEKDPDTQQVVAMRHYISTYEQNRTIWMDGRPHPSASAPHTFMGFSTGQWVGDMLRVQTTHIKQGWVRRNGLPESDQSSMVEYFILHGNGFTHVTILSDPVYLTEPLIKTEDFQRDEKELGNWLWPCEPVEEIIDRPKGDIPHFQLGENPYLNEFFTKWKIPKESSRGGAETMYPEYIKRIETLRKAGN